ncbi:MAG TPA: pyridoxal phosphate-dependent aminotransferase [Pyrinomonadaceae bacterium]|nr:pyridoxal phosphate-dependent aminotransferase [Pyrinomonadaceae bacterium]
MSKIALSRRAIETPASPIRRLVPYADRAKARGIKVYHLNIGQPDIETPAEMMDGYRNVDIKVLSYGPSQGLKEYIDALVLYYRGVGIEVRAQDILVTTGGSEAIMFALDTVADAGDEVIVPEPFYTNYAGFASTASVKLVPVTCLAETGFALPAKAEFERAITSRTRAIIYSNPGNPTGAVFTRSELEMLAELCVEHGLYLIGDEAYREFIYDDDTEHTSVLNLPGIEDRAILVDSVSKRYSACGARIGCVISRNAELMAAVLKFGQARLCPPTVDQLAAMAAVKVPDSYFAETRREYQSRRDLVCDAIAKIPGAVCLKPRGAFYVMPKLPIRDGEEFAIFMLEEFQLDNETVMVAPAEGFYGTPGMGKDEVRIAYVLNCDDLARAMKILAAGVEAYNRSR